MRLSTRAWHPLDLRLLESHYVDLFFNLSPYKASRALQAVVKALSESSPYQASPEPPKIRNRTLQFLKFKKSSPLISYFGVRNTCHVPGGKSRHKPQTAKDCRVVQIRQTSGHRFGFPTMERLDAPRHSTTTSESPSTGFWTKLDCTYSEATMAESMLL